MGRRCVCCRLPASVTDNISSYLVQRYLALCSLEQFDSVWWSRGLSDHVVEMSRHKVANFILQSAITRLHTQQQVTSLSYKLTGVSLSPHPAILLLQLQTIMHRKRAVYSSNSSVFNYHPSGHNKRILLTHETSCHNP